MRAAIFVISFTALGACSTSSRAPSGNDAGSRRPDDPGKSPAGDATSSGVTHPDAAPPGSSRDAADGSAADGAPSKPTPDSGSEDSDPDPVLTAHERDL